MPAQDRPAPRFDESRRGKPLSRRSRQRRRTLESALAAAVMPRYMERLRAIEDELALLRHRLEKARAHVGRVCGDDAERFEREWLRTVEDWRFDELNELIRRHNEWYPVEADLPHDPRTGEYLTVGGRDFRRPEVDVDWVLERYPARLRTPAPGTSS